MASFYIFRGYPSGPHKLIEDNILTRKNPNHIYIYIYTLDLACFCFYVIGVLLISYIMLFLYPLLLHKLSKYQYQYKNKLFSDRSTREMTQIWEALMVDPSSVTGFTRFTWEALMGGIWDRWSGKFPIPPPLSPSPNKRKYSPLRLRSWLGFTTPM